MPDKISGITGVSYNPSRVEPVRRHSKAEVDAIFDSLEEQEKERAEIREYLARFPNPNKLSFSELLAQERNGAQDNDNDDEGFVLDIKNQ